MKRWHDVTLFIGDWNLRSKVKGDGAEVSSVVTFPSARGSVPSVSCRRSESRRRSTMLAGWKGVKTSRQLLVRLFSAAVLYMTAMFVYQVWYTRLPTGNSIIIILILHLHASRLILYLTTSFLLSIDCFIDYYGLFIYCAYFRDRPILRWFLHI